MSSMANNSCWLSSSSSGSRDPEDDCRSVGSVTKGHQNTSTSSAKSDCGMPGRARSRGDRYSHYRKDVPTRVNKPWMRDKAATGGHRFGGSVATRINAIRSPAAESPRVGSNSRPNSVPSNNASFQHSARPFLNEVVPLTTFSSQNLFHTNESFKAPIEEDQAEKLEKPNAGKGEYTVSPSLLVVDPEEETATVDIETASNAEKEINASLPAVEIEDDHRSVALAAACTPKQEDGGLIAVAGRSGKQRKYKQPDSGNKAISVSSEVTSEHVLRKEQETPRETERNIEPTHPGLPHQREWDNKSMVEVSNKHEDLFYDVLPTIRPSTYNPMAAACCTPTTATFDKLGFMSTFASLKKPIPTVQSPSAMLNNAIAEAWDEETSFDDHDNIHNMSGDTLQGIKALDASREESYVEGDDVNFDFSRMEPQLAGDDHWKKMWPSCVDIRAVPPTLFPSDWEQRQTMAAGATHAWIQRQLQQKLQGIDFKASAYSDFVASLSDCPALTSGFLASDSSISICFCPCSAQMEGWSAERLSDTEEFLYDGTEKCESQQLTPRGLVEHCLSILKASENLEIRFLHGIIHNYLESVMGPSHEAFQTQVMNDIAADEDVPDSISIQRTAPKKSDGVKGDSESFFENEELLQKLELADDSRGQLKANMGAASTSTAEHEELTKLRVQVMKLEAVNTQLTDKLKLVVDSRLQLETITREASITAVEQKGRLQGLQEMAKKAEKINFELLGKLDMSQEAEMELVENNGAAVVAIREHTEQLKCFGSDKQALEVSSRSLQEKLAVVEEQGTLHESDGIAYLVSATKVAEEMKALKTVKSELQQELSRATALMKELEAKTTESTATLKILGEDIKKMGKTNAELTEKLQEAKEKHTDTVASSRARAEMMKELCEEMRQLEEANMELKQKLKQALETTKTNKANNVTAANSNVDATTRIGAFQDEGALVEVNRTLKEDLADADDQENPRASQEKILSLTHVRDTPVDLARFRFQCQKYFSKLRVTQLKSHCVRDKSSVKIIVEYDPKKGNCIDIQRLLDQGAAVESQDATYLFRALDTFNKGHFHTHKLLLPWKIATSDGDFVSRSEFFLQVWQQVGGLRVKVGEKETEVPLFQETLGFLVPMPNAALESMLRVTPAELNRIFAAKIAPYYRALGRLMFQCIGATADDSADYNLKIFGSFMPMILRQKLFRGVDPVDETYPLEQLLEHAFSLLGIDMSRDKAFEYFGIEARDYDDTQSAVSRVREEVQEMWIKERSLALEAISEGLSLNGLADMSFCCGLVPLEAINEVMFTK